MLHIQIGPDPSANRDAIIAGICDRAQQGATPDSILLVPEQFSHAAEYRLCQLGGDSICLSAEVLSFSRLAARVFSPSMGGVCRQMLDEGGRLPAMRRAVEQLESRLKLYAANVSKTEFLTRLLDVVDELEHQRITPSMLQTAAQKAQGRLAVKLEELGLIFESYLTVLSTQGLDAGICLDQLHQCLLEEDFAENHSFYVYGFTDFTQQEFAILQTLLQHSGCMTVSILCAVEQSGLAFESARETIQRLKKLAQELQIPIQVTQAPQPLDKAPALLQLQSKLFSADNTPGSNAGEISVRHYQSVQDECLAVTGAILELLRGGSRLKEIAVVVADGPGYLTQLRSCFAQYHLPAYFSGNTAMLVKPVIQTVLSALRAAGLGMERADVVNYLKSGLSPLNWEQCDQVENYAVVWNIHATRWEQTWTLHPAGLHQEFDEASQERLAQLNASRELGIAPLCKLKDGLLQRGSVAEKVLAVWAFLEEIGLNRRLRRRPGSYRRLDSFKWPRSNCSCLNFSAGRWSSCIACLGT